MPRFGKAVQDKVGDRLKSLKTSADGSDVPIASRKIERAAPRRNTYMFGRVLTGKSGEFKCIIKDISIAGAHIAFEGAASLPSQVTLKIDQTCTTQKCRVAWRDENEAGLAFVD